MNVVAKMDTISQPEHPLYTLHQSLPRALVPKIVLLLLLSAVFYGGVLLNLSLLEIKEVVSSQLQYGTGAFLLIVNIMGILLAARQATRPYFFYPNRIVFFKKELPYTAIIAITAINPHQNILDKLFHTSSLPLAAEFTIYHIPHDVDLQHYLQQMITYAHNSQ